MSLPLRMLLGLMLGLLFRMWKGASLGLSLKNVSRTLAVAPVTVNLLVGQREREKVEFGVVDLQEYVVYCTRGRTILFSRVRVVFARRKDPL